MQKTPCERFDEIDGVVSIVKKRAHRTLEKAQEAADKQNTNLEIVEKLNPYKCSNCEYYHVGRNGELLTQADTDEAWERIKPDEYKSINFKVVGKIDLSQFPEKVVKLTKKQKKEKRRMEEAEIEMLENNNQYKIRLIKDKVRSRKLAKDFIEETNSKDLGWLSIGMFNLIKMAFWSVFQEYRAIYYMQRCLDGMAHKVAWNNSCKISKKELMKELKKLDWAK